MQHWTQASVANANANITPLCRVGTPLVVGNCKGRCLLLPPGTLLGWGPMY